MINPLSFVIAFCITWLCGVILGMYIEWQCEIWRLWDEGRDQRRDQRELRRVNQRAINTARRNNAKISREL